MEALDLGFRAILSLPVPPACGGRSVACPRARFPHVDHDGAYLLDAGFCVVAMCYSSDPSPSALRAVKPRERSTTWLQTISLALRVQENHVVPKDHGINHLLHMTGQVFCFYLVDYVGFEPTTAGLYVRCSTTELTVRFPTRRACPIAPPVVTDRIQHASMPFGLRPTQRCFTAPGIIFPLSLALESRSPTQTVELNSYLLIFHRSSGVRGRHRLATVPETPV